MIVLEAAGYAARRTTGMLLHPLQTTREVVADAGHIVGLGVETATRIVSGRGAGTVQGPNVPPVDQVKRRGSVPAEDLVSRPGPVPPELLDGAATPLPKPEPPKAPRTARKVGEEPKTMAGTTAAGIGHNPATGEPNLPLADDEPLLDTATVKAVASEAAMMRKAASTKK